MFGKEPIVLQDILETFFTTIMTIIGDLTQIITDAEYQKIPSAFTRSSTRMMTTGLTIILVVIVTKLL